MILQDMIQNICLDQHRQGVQSEQRQPQLPV